MKVKQSKFKPFVLVTNEDEETQVTQIAVGNQIACPMKFESEKDAEKYLSEQPYEMFINLYSIFKYYESKDKKQNAQNVEASTKENI